MGASLKRRHGGYPIPHARRATNGRDRRTLEKGVGNGMAAHAICTDKECSVVVGEGRRVAEPVLGHAEIKLDQKRIQIRRGPSTSIRLPPRTAATTAFLNSGCPTTSSMVTTKASVAWTKV